MQYVVQKGSALPERTSDLTAYPAEDGWVVLREEPDGEPPPEHFLKVEGGQLVDDAESTEKAALEKIERDADNATEGDFKRVRRQLAVMLLWEEIQRLKLASLVPGAVPAEVTERRKMFPTLMAVVALSGNTLAQVANALESRLAPSVRRAALWQAKILVAEDNIRAAGTAAAKMAAAEINWTE